MADCDIDQELDILYSPSNWPCKERSEFTSEQLLQDYFEKVAEGSLYVYETYKQKIKVVKYGDKACEQIDVISPLDCDLTLSQGEHCQRGAMFVFLHGGYWQQGYFRSDSIHLGRPLLEAGYHHAAIGYLDNTEQPTLAQLTERVITAVNTLCDFAADHGFSSLIVSGHSAGAHLAAMAMLSDRLNDNAKKLITGLVLMSGVYDLIPLLKTSINIPPLAVPNIETAKMLSPQHLMSTQNKTVVLHSLKQILVGYGEYESTGFREQAKNMSKLLSERGLSSRVVEVAGKDHFNLVTELFSSSNALHNEFLELLGKP